MKRSIVLAVLVSVAACGDDDGAAARAPTSAASPPNAANDWPPTGTDCAELAACCASLPSDAQLFCRLAATNTPGDCRPALDQVRTYLGERGASVPPTCQSVPTANANGSGPSWVAIALPSSVEGWQRQPDEDNGPEQGYVADYLSGDEMSASIFVYRGGAPSVGRDAATLTGEVQRAFQGMQRAVAAGAYRSVRPAGDVEMTTLGEGGPAAAHQRVVIETDAGPRLSETFVTTHRGFLFKLRVTINVEPTPELAHRLNQLYAALGGAVTEG